MGTILIKIEKLLKLGILISLVVLLYSVHQYPSNPCALCDFEVEGENLNIREFSELYSNQCFIDGHTLREDDLDFTLNFSSG